jgi:nicotinate phosphoribosyltransferase
MSVINSILHNDLYKFSMSNYYIQNFPQASGTFAFHDRNQTEYCDEFVAMLKEEFDSLRKLFLQKNEFDWAVTNIPYIPQFYWEWLRSFRYEPDKIKVWLDDAKHLHIEVTDLMYKVTFYEIPILAIVSACFHRFEKHGYQTRPELENIMLSRLDDKIEIAKQHNLFFADFGMRRAYNDLTEEIVVSYLKDNCPTFVGTSTVSLAMKYGVKPIGTMAHECFMFQAAIHSPKDANFMVMENWVKVYDGNLGTVLTDTYTVDVFLRNFSMKLAKLYDGVRHDSGDPFEFGDKMIAKYKSYGIDPMSKTIVFSDGLNFQKAAEIKEYFAGKIKVTFGIGTNLTCDIPGIKPMNIVMKLKECRVNDRQPLFKCVKLSDVHGKETGDINEVKLYRQVLGLE